MKIFISYVTLEASIILNIAFELNFISVYRFPNIEHFFFAETNICFLGQLNVLAETQGLLSLQINDEGNPITNKKWKSYALFRLSHWGLKVINGHEVSIFISIIGDINITY